jgi:hypothetical protein
MGWEGICWITADEPHLEMRVSIIDILELHVTYHMVLKHLVASPMARLCRSGSVVFTQS